MTKEEKYSAPEEEKKESVLDFEEAKEMTIGQASRKSEELEAGVTADDNVLDKYIKQHREEIEADKYEARENSQNKFADTSLELEDLIKEIRSEARAEASAEAETPEEESPVAEPEESSKQATESISPSPTLQEEIAEDSEVTQAFSSPPLSQEKLEAENLDEAEVEQATLPLDDLATSLKRSQKDQASEDWQEEEEKQPFYKKKKLIYSSLALLALAIGGTSYLLLNQSKQSTKTKTTSSSSSSQKSSTSSDTTDNPDLKAFNDLYDSFFTDKNKISLKNSSFPNISKLKTALEKLKDSKEYNVAKAKYDSLLKQIEAIQAVNSQFETAAITDGVLDSNAKAKADAKFAEGTTGNDHLDKLIKSAISQAKGQQTVAPSNPTPAPAPEASQETSPAQRLQAVQLLEMAIKGLITLLVQPLMVVYQVQGLTCSAISAVYHMIKRRLTMLLTQLGPLIREFWKISSIFPASGAILAAINLS